MSQILATSFLKHLILDYKTFPLLHIQILFSVTFGQEINKQTKNKKTITKHSKKILNGIITAEYVIFTGKEELSHVQVYLHGNIPWMTIDVQFEELPTLFVTLQV